MLDSYPRDWKKQRDEKVESGNYDVSLICSQCGQIVNEKVSGCRIPTLIDRTCQLVYEWSYFAERWYKTKV